MKAQRYMLVAVGMLAVGAAVVYSQTSGTKSTAPQLPASLKSWIGQECTVYLHLEFDPRAGKSSFSSSSSDGYRETEGIPMSVTGTVSSVEDDAITVTNGPRTTWIPRDQVRVITSYRP